VAYLGPNDSAADVMDSYFERISHPALTDVKIDWGQLQVCDIYPSRMPDLFVGRPVILTGRIKGGSHGMVRVSGQADEQTVEFNLPATAATHKGLASVWARLKIADLADRSLYERQDKLSAQMRRVALDYSLMSAYTAFVAVDSSARTKGDNGTTVPVAVPVPDGVQYKTTVPE